MKWLAYIPVLFLAASLCTAGPVIRSTAQVTTWGFPDSTSSADTGINGSPLLDTDNSVTFRIRERTITSGLSYSALQHTQFYARLHFQKRNLSWEGGGFLGFPADLPLTFTPGLYGSVLVPLGSYAHLRIYGSTSLFLSPSVTKDPGRSPIDQDLMGVCFIRPVGEADVKLLYEHRESAIPQGTGSLKKNRTRTCGMNVDTLRREGRIGTNTGIGVESARFKSASTLRKLMGFYVEETLRVRFGRAAVLAGTRAYIITIHLKGLKSASIPTFPIFSLSTGVELKL